MRGYLLCFILAITLAFLSERSYKKNNLFLGKLFLVLSLFVPCFIAGVRNITVGKDVSSYFMVLFKGFTSGESFLFVTQKAGVEIGYAIFMYIASLFKNVNIALFLSEFLVCLPIYLLAYDNKKKYSLTFTITIFLLTLYCLSLNLMRQSIAISFIIYGISLFERENKNWKYMFLLAFLFHYSAIICLLMIFIIYICKKMKKNRIFLIFLILTSVVIFSLTFEWILMLIPNKYSYYIGSQYDVSSFSFASIIKKIIWIVPFIIYLGRYKNKNDDEYALALSYFTFFLIDFVLYFMSLQLSSAGRLGYFFLYAGYFYFFPRIKNLFSQKAFIYIGVTILLCLFWYNMTVVNYKENRTYPYTSSIIDLLNEN